LELFPKISMLFLENVVQRWVPSVTVKPVLVFRNDGGTPKHPV